MTTLDAPAPTSASADLGFDPKALRDRYRAERDRRLKREGNDQYREIAGDFAHYAEDPYVDPGFTRAPLSDEIEVVVIGGGFGGLLTGARLKEAGVSGVRIIEKGGDFGGTWYWNRYPGAACDVESYIYLPLLEETGRMPVEKYSRAPEILEHSRAVGRHFDLYKDALFQTEVTELRWDAGASRWIVSTNRGDRIRARFVAMAAGPLHRPKLPGIPGVETFARHSFHTSRWDYAYTGGDSMGGLTGLSDKRVGIIGTGATAVQCVPYLGRYAKHLYVFQRTPSSIDRRDNRPTDPGWAGSLQPGWQRSRMENFNTLVSGGHAEEDLVADGWTDIIRNLTVMARTRAAKAGAANPGELVQLADFKKMEQIRARVDDVVKDKATAEALKPWYNQFCKRPCFHDDYLDTFNRPNVTLVDTQGRGVDGITPTGVVANGVEYELDCLIYGTGFEVGTGFSRRAGYETHGRGGRTLTDKWAGGMSTLHGMHARDFPNLFVLSNPQAALTVNFPHLLDEQAGHVAYIVGRCIADGVTEVETTEIAESAWVDTILAGALDRQQFAEECTPGYYNNEGQPSALAVRNGPYGRGSIAFIDILKRWREDGAMAGLERRRQAGA